MSASRAHRDVKASGVRLRVAVAGQGAPVIFLHGLFVNHASWLPVRDALSNQFMTVAPDFPGFGESEKPPANRFAYSAEAFAETIADLYAGLDLGRAAVVGHALGGAVALALAAHHPELVSRLVLVDALCYEAPVDARRRIALIPVIGGFVFKQLWGRSTFRSFYRNLILSGSDAYSNSQLDEYYDAFNTPASRGSALATMRATSDTRAVAAHTGRISAPTLVVWGRHDRIYPARLGQRLAREIRGAGFQLMDTGHAPHEQHPEAFASILQRFLRAERPAGS
jgi:pimeloyl-ACP methyl ester carboxylesterase